MMSAKPNKAQVYAYLNVFVEPPRLEVLLDWNDETPWPDADWIGKEIPFNVLLIHADAAPDFSVSSVYADACVLPWIGGKFLDVNTRERSREFVAETLAAVWKTVPRRFSYGSDNPIGAKNLTLTSGPHYHFDYTLPKQTKGTGEVLKEAHEKYVGYADTLLQWRDSVRKLMQVDAKDRFPSRDEETPSSIQAFRKICRDEPTLGNLFHVLAFSMVDVSGCRDFLDKDPLWLVARPLVGGVLASVSDYLPVPTRVVKIRTTAPVAVGTSLSEPPISSDPDANLKSFFGSTIAVRQVTSVEIAARPPKYRNPVRADKLAQRYRNIGYLLTHEDLHAAAERLCPINREGEGKDEKKGCMDSI